MKYPISVYLAVLFALVAQTSCKSCSNGIEKDTPIPDVQPQQAPAHPTTPTIQKVSAMNSIEARQYGLNTEDFVKMRVKTSGLWSLEGTSNPRKFQGFTFAALPFNKAPELTIPYPVETILAPLTPLLEQQKIPTLANPFMMIEMSSGPVDPKVIINDIQSESLSRIKISYGVPVLDGQKAEPPLETGEAAAGKVFAFEMDWGVFTADGPEKFSNAMEGFIDEIRKGGFTPVNRIWFVGRRQVDDPKARTVSIVVIPVIEPSTGAHP